MRSLPEHWVPFRLGELVRAELATVDPTNPEYFNLPYVSAENMVKEEGVLAKVRKVGEEGPVSSSHLFMPGQVLYSRIRPGLNKVFLAASEGLSSAEVYPLTVIETDKLLPRFLTYALRTTRFVRYAVANSSGAHIPRLSVEKLYSYKLYLPPTLAEQEQITDLLDAAATALRQRRAANEELAKVPSALFVEMFGASEQETAAEVDYLPLFELIENSPQNGIYKHADYYGEQGTPIVRIDSFYDGEITDLRSLRRVRLNDDEQQRYTLRTGNVLINRVNSIEYIGKSAVVPALQETTVFESNMMRLQIDQERLLPEILVTYLLTDDAKTYFRRVAKQAINQASINQTDVRRMRVPVPDMDRQQEFVQISNKLKTDLTDRRQQEADLRATFDALLEWAFPDPGQPVNPATISIFKPDREVYNLLAPDQQALWQYCALLSRAFTLEGLLEQTRKEHDSLAQQVGSMTRVRLTRTIYLLMGLGVLQADHLTPADRWRYYQPGVEGRLPL